MIDQVHITFAPDGGVLLTLPRSGMDPAAETVFSAAGGILRIGQAGRWFAYAPFADPADEGAVSGNPDVTVVEADEAGLLFHGSVRECAA